MLRQEDVHGADSCAFYSLHLHPSLSLARRAHMTDIASAAQLRRRWQALAEDRSIEQQSPGTPASSRTFHHGSASALVSRCEGIVSPATLRAPQRLQPIPLLFFGKLRKAFSAIFRPNRPCPTHWSLEAQSLTVIICSSDTLSRIGEYACASPGLALLGPHSCDGSRLSCRTARSPNVRRSEHSEVSKAVRHLRARLTVECLDGDVLRCPGLNPTQSDLMSVSVISTIRTSSSLCRLLSTSGSRASWFTSVTLLLHQLWPLQ